MKELVKVCIAGVCVFICFFVLIAIADTFLKKNSPIVMGVVCGIVFLVVMVIIFVAFNRRGIKINREAKKDIDACIAELNSAGLVQREHYHALRAFGVEEWEDEGSHYFIELDDKRVLYLNGQYLYDYEPDDGYDGEPPTPRTFPCEEFEILRHSSEHYVLQIVCQGAVIEPEFITPPFTENDWKQRKVPQDGDIISDRSYDDIKSERLNAVQR